jgi:hypothetical protein
MSDQRSREEELNLISGIKKYFNGKYKRIACIAFTEDSNTKIETFVFGDDSCFEFNNGQSISALLKNFMENYERLGNEKAIVSDELKNKLKERNHYLRGFIEGIAEYAHMINGVTYVGTCGSTLKEAIAPYENIIQENERIFNGINASAIKETP